MGKDNEKLAKVLQSLKWQIHDAQCVLTNPYDIRQVCGWLSKEGTFYSLTGFVTTKKIEEALQEEGYYVVSYYGTRE